MSAVQFTRRTAPAWTLNLCQWPHINLTGLDAQEQQRIERWMLVLEKYLHGARMTPILASYRFTHKQLLRHFNRCIGVGLDGRLYGWRGLLKGTARKPYLRTQPVNSAVGAAGALRLVFNTIPGLEQRLINLVLKRPETGEIHEARISNKQLHKIFMEECRQAGLSATQWPFSARFKGRRSIDTFVHDVIHRYPERAARVRYGEVAGSKMLAGTGQDALLLAFSPFDVAEMDEHKIDLIGTVGIPTPVGIAWVAIERIWILVIADSVSGAILGYCAVIRRECDSEDMLVAVTPLAVPSARRALQVEGMTYVPGSGLPLGTVDGLPPFGVCALMIDNALINLSRAVHERIVDRLGCAVNWGPVRKWLRRPLIERINRALEQAGFQRVVSTTGSGPKDPRRNDPVRAALRHGVQLDYVLDLIDVEIASYNATHSEGRCFGLSPLEVIEQTVAGIGCPTLLPQLPPPSVLHPELDVLVFTATIRGDLTSGHRPSIKFHRARYTNPTIAGSFGLVGKEVVLHVRRNDIRTIEVFLKENGASLGAVQVLGAWRREPHSLEMRRQINRHIDDGRLTLEDGMDPVTAMHCFLAKQAAAQSKQLRPTISKEGTALARESVVTQRPVRGNAPRSAAVKPAFSRSRHAPTLNPHPWSTT